LILPEVSFEKPNNEYAIILFQLTVLKSCVVTLPLDVVDDEHRVSMLLKDIVHEKSGDPTVSIAKGMNCDELEVRKGREVYRMHRPFIVVIPIEELHE